MLNDNFSRRAAPTFKRSCLATAIATAALMTSVSPVALAAQAENMAIEEVLVTSRRRAESLQEVPVSVTALTTADIEDVGITDISHVSTLVPNLVIQPNTGGSDGTAVCMRGLCRTDFTLTEDPMVGVYVDGVFISKSVGSLFDMAELERIEVLRGPQGTLYGRNTLGGAVLLHSRKPTGEYGTKMSATVGNFGRTDGRLYSEFPLNEQLAASVSLLSKNRDPFVENSNPAGSDRWDEESLSARMALAYNPTDALTIDYAYDWQKKRETPLAVQLTSATGPTFAAFAGDVRSDYEDDINTIGKSLSDVDIDGHNLTLSFDLGNDLTLKSISGYRKVENHMATNSAGSSAGPIIMTDENYDLTAKSQELQLSGPALDGALEFVVGLFYFTEEGEHELDQIFLANRNLSSTTIENSSAAIFGEVTWNVSEQLEATLGLRYTDEEREADRQIRALPGGFLWFDTKGQTFGGFPAAFDTKIDDTSIAPRFTLSYHINDDIMIFGGYSRGFKSGGFSSRSFSPLQWGPYDEVKLDSYELGLKSSWADNQVRFNATAFYEDIEDMQSQVNSVDPLSAGGFSSVIQNAAEATIQGLEIELIVQLIPGLNINAGYGYIDAEYDKFISYDAVLMQDVDVSDDRAVEFTPEHSYNLSLVYDVPLLKDIGELSARLDWSSQSKVRFTPIISGNDDIAQSSYDLLNMRIALDEIQLGDGALSFALWAKNLTDEEYKIGGYEINFGPGGRAGISQWGEPRTYGLDVTYRLGSMR